MTGDKTTQDDTGIPEEEKLKEIKSELGLAAHNHPSFS